ncbi:DNA helicase MCM9 isoform X2 [Pseudoliparis swirei]|uniref:DNA helicase MCM9 isoform X2 n=1 Tax=Pseudoliparis swirei TaxID=2059687 RepID=UPI0024BD6F61|nr:DNA helicase MCM9 isoform X2 [Pseudoliparis swirei]
MTMSPDQEALIGRVFETYLKDHHHEDIRQLIADTNEETHRPVLVNAMTLFEANMEVGDYFNAFPHEVLSLFDGVLSRMALQLSRCAGAAERRTPSLHARITGLPVCPELTRDTVPRARDIGHFLSVTGTVIRTSVAKVLEHERAYMCSKCRHVFTAQADFHQFYVFVPPAVCPSPEGCTAATFSCLDTASEPQACRDLQEIKIQEQVQRLSVGSIPRALLVVLEDDLVDSCKSGRNQILLSLCPQVFGMFVIKLAVAMVMAGGVQRVDSSGTKIRGECHMLLVGDPGTGKSQFLKYAAKIMPRSVLTAGIGSTSAGLTVAAVKDGGEWHLEAGALVLSDGGLCCIDEFNNIKEHDRISIHEAMEQQTISVAKAGMVCKLSTRTSILAAANPKGRYDPAEPLSVNVALASPLLSRFDLVLVLLDTRNAEWDHVISSFILEDRGPPAGSCSTWCMEKMKAYFGAVRRLQPQLSDDANTVLTRYYQLQRRSSGRNPARTTIRMLESLSRLAEAHARLMYRATVTVEDAVVAVSVMECSMQGGALLGGVNALLTCFPHDPAEQHRAQSRVLLEGLNLPLLLHKEMDRLDRLKSSSSQATGGRDPPEDPHQHVDPPEDPHQHGDPPEDPHQHGDPPEDPHQHVDPPEDPGLDWFQSISSSLATAPEVKRSDSLPSAPAEEGPLRRAAGPHPPGTSTPGPQGGLVDQRSSGVHQQEQQSRGRSHGGPPESPRCVFQTVSKSLRARRRELTRPPPPKPLEDQDQRARPGAQDPGTGPQGKMAAAAETAPELRARLSSLVFAPQRKRPLVRSPQRRTPCDPSGPGPAGPEDPDPPPTHMEKRTRRNQDLHLSVGAAGEGAPPSHSRAAVASSTRARLSRFSFGCSVKGDAPEPRSGAKVTEVTPGQEPRSEATGTTSAGPSAGIVRKRRCFELGAPQGGAGGPQGGAGPGPQAVLSGPSLFDSVLDTDWDQEVPRRGGEAEAPPPGLKTHL